MGIPMTPFDRHEQATETAPNERLQTFTKAMWSALVPDNGECVSVQGELVRANERLFSELLRNGMGNYYDEREDVRHNYYGRLVLLILDTLVENRGGALDADDVAYFRDTHGRLDRDRQVNLRRSELEQREEPLTEDEIRESEALDRDPHLITWEALFNRAERCIANWCIANPALVDRNGRPIVERGVRNIDEIFNPPAPPPKCPLCNGRGFIQPQDERSFPKRCSCPLGK
jgi:hypothetical protein